MNLRAYFVRNYLSIDPRSLALFRVVFGCVLMLDLYWRFLDVDVLYTNSGLFPNHTMLWAPPARRMFSFFFMASTPAEARVGMAVCAIVFSVLIVGYRTRLFQVLSLLCLISLNTRVALLENGGDIVLNNFAVWTVFLPLGQRFSVDAVLASMRARAEHVAGDLADREAMRAPHRPVVSIVALAIVLQIFVIYFFNFVHKTGPTWMQGTAVHLALHQDRIATAFAVWFREHAPPNLLQALTYGTLGVEAAGAALVISPLWPSRTRLVAIVMMPLLHLGFALCLNLGPFSYAMATSFTLLVHERHWNWVAQKLRGTGPHLRCYFDADCGICFQFARLLARLDLWERIQLVSNQERSELPAQISDDVVAHTIVVRDEATKRLSTRSDAIAELFRALPLGTLPWLLLKMPGLRALWLRLYDVVARNRTSISQFFGLHACGLPTRAADVQAPTPENGPAKLRRRAGRVMSESLAVVVIAASVGEVVNVNAAVPSWLRYPQPDALQSIIEYGRLIQGWRMFAPDGPLTDMMLVVEAKTIDGRTIDPYNEIASRPLKPPFDQVPNRLGNDQFFTTYSLLIPAERMRPYWGAFEQWILAYPVRTGRPKDQVLSFKVYTLTDTTPLPGLKKPTGLVKALMMSYPHTP